jgi:hypothetical protein
VTTFVVLHLVSGILDLVYMGQTEVNGRLLVNTVLRFTVVAVFSLYGGYPVLTTHPVPVGSAPSACIRDSRRAHP